MINGTVSLHGCSKEGTSLRHTVKAHDHNHPCRAVRFSLDGELVLTASTDRSVLAIDTATGNAVARKKDAHPASISRLMAVSEKVMASGDEDGGLKFWDSRQSNAIADLSPHTDYVSDMCMYDAEHALLSVSGDGTLVVTDIRTMKIKETSEGDADDELLSVVVLKGGRKIVCGTTSGVLNVWSWGYWNDCSDRFPGHPESVTSLLKYDEDTMLTASSDGLIRVLSLQPNKMLGVLGEHGDFDVERLAATADLALLASASHDSTVKLWDLHQLADEEDDDNDDNEEVKADQGTGDGREEEEEEEQDTDEEGHAVRITEGKTREKRKKRGEHKIASKKHQSMKDSNFFSGLL